MTWVDKTRAIVDMSFYINSLDGLWKSGLTYGIIETGTLVGTVGFHHTDMRNKKTEIGYWIAPSHQGKGLATLAGKTAINAVFRFTDINRIEAKIQDTNKASEQVIKKLKFTYEGIEREGIKTSEHFWSHQVYSLLRSDLGSSQAL